MLHLSGGGDGDAGPVGVGAAAGVGAPESSPTTAGMAICRKRKSTSKIWQDLMRCSP
jgi:hypothetical protein